MIRILTLVIVLSNSVAAQIDCDVTVNFDNVSQVQDRLQTFGQDIENYINSNKWAAEDLGGEKIACTMNIFFVATSGENSYQAQVFIASTRPVFVGSKASKRQSIMLRVFDDKWEFTYNQGQPLQRNESQFDALTDFLDFYMYMIVGFDFDSYDLLGGTQYFQKALTLVNQAPASSKGWDRGTATTYSKFSLADEINNPKNRPFREGYFLYHYKGLDLLATQPETAYESMITLLKNISTLKKTANPRAIIFRTFFETKYEELADVFKGYSDASVYQLLVQVDPAHINAYEQAAKRK
jgi:hypothetical protein